MLKVVVGAAALAIAALPACAADKLGIGPAPEWVKPLEISAPDAAEGAGPARILLEDHQLHFGPEGVTEFVERAVQVRNSQGLLLMGSIGLAWSPDTDTVAVHRLRILRRGETIDVLGRQSFTVIRREAQLERAIVDGMLTATLQPEGLQIGDVVDIAYSVTHLDPILQGHADYATLLAPFTKAERLRLRASWDAKRPLQWRAGEGLSKPTTRRTGDRFDLDIDVKDAPDAKFTIGAPPRYMPLRDVSVSDFKNWSEVSALMAPLFTKATVLASDSPLKAEAAKIRAASADPKVQAGAALRLVEEKVRYLAVVLNLGGYVPADADRTWERRYGDCKAKTALLLALLHELGIEAESALVSATRGDGLDSRLPALSAFDHVIVRAVIGGQVYWLDGTRTGDRSLAALTPPPFLWALPVRERDATLTAIDRPPLTAPAHEMRLRVDASAGLEVPAKVHGEMILAGDRAARFDRSQSNEDPKTRDKALRQLWSAYSWIDIKAVTSTEDPDTGAVHIVMDGTGRAPFSRSTVGRDLRIEAADLDDTFVFERGKDQPHPDAPYLVADYPSYTAFSLSVVLPRGGDGFFFMSPDVDTVIAGRAIKRRSRIEKGVATVETSQRSLVREFPAADAPKAIAALAELAKVDVVLRGPAGYRPTDQDMAAMQEQTPTTVSGFIDRGDRFMDQNRNAEAMADFEKAVALDPKSAFAYANRALGHIYGGRLEAAKADIEKAQSLDPRNFVTLHAVGLVAAREARYADAAAAFGRAADLHEGDTFALNAQAGAYIALGDTDKALAALAELERVSPGAPDIHLQRYRAYVISGQRDRALAEVEAAIAKRPDDARLHLYRGSMLAAAGRSAEADKAFARSIELTPTVRAYLTRASFRPVEDLAGRLADIAAAEKVEPGLTFIAARRADALAQTGRYDEALASLSAPLKAHPDDETLLLARADVYARAGRVALAVKDFEALRAKSHGVADELNTLCWSQAVRNFALETALGDCDAALKVAPRNVNALDSRAFVLMRLGRLQEALIAYDMAVTARPRQAESLYGRALTHLRLNQATEGQADLTAARAIDPRIDITFKDYGLGPPTGGAPNPSPSP